VRRKNIYKYPQVRDACVIGIPDEAQVQAVKAYVVLKNPGEASPALEKELIDHCRTELIKWSCPRVSRGSSQNAGRQNSLQCVLARGNCEIKGGGEACGMIVAVPVKKCQAGSTILVALESFGTSRTNEPAGIQREKNNKAICFWGESHVT